MASKMPKAREEFLTELAYDNPEPTEPWKARANWDPMFPLSVIDGAARAGLIETRGDRLADNFAYRFTPAGRAALKEA
jgi:hypothetical protein